MSCAQCYALHFCVMPCYAHHHFGHARASAHHSQYEWQLLCTWSVRFRRIKLSLLLKNLVHAHRTSLVITTCNGGITIKFPQKERNLGPSNCRRCQCPLEGALTNTMIAIYFSFLKTRRLCWGSQAITI